LGDSSRLGLALTGLATFYSNRGEVERGRELGARVLAAAEQSGDREQALEGHFQVGFPEHFQGKFASSLAHCEAVRPLYDSERHYALVSVLAIDPGVAALGYAAWNLWQLGWPDRALARAREAVVLAHELGHPFSLGQALLFETCVHWLRRDVTATREGAAKTIALGEAYGLALWVGLGRTFHAATPIAGREPVVADVLTGLALFAKTAVQLGASLGFGLLGEVYVATGQLADARRAVETGLAVAAQAGEAFWDADLHRLQGEIVLATGGTPANAATLFHRALGIARAQQAKALELRAATSLARLLRDQGRVADARALLAPVYGWFTEGFDTRDLIEAKALLDELT